MADNNDLVNVTEPQECPKAIAISLDSLVVKSQQTLEQILEDPTVPAVEKAEIALKILQLANANNQFLPNIATLKATEVQREQEIDKRQKLELEKETETLLDSPHPLQEEVQPYKEKFDLGKRTKTAKTVNQIIREQQDSSTLLPVYSCLLPKGVAISHKNATLPLSFIQAAGVDNAQIQAFKNFSHNELEQHHNFQLFLAEYVQLDNFLNPEEYQQVLDVAFAKQAEFVNSRTVTNAANYRQSAILYATLFPDIYYLVKKKILSKLPEVLQQLNHPEFDVSKVEMQMTAHNDGGFYKVHTDAGSNKTETRELTYVYYFYQTPKRFSGGELKLYDTEMKNNSFQQKERSQTVEPRNNSLVFFNSRCKHEVLPISCSSQNFQHSRFTLNGWLRR